MRPQHRLIDLPKIADQRGALTFGQQGDHIPFAVKRFFVVYNVAEGAGRGGHAHREQHQLLIMLAGSATIVADNGAARTPIDLNRPNLALHAPPMMWLDLEGFTRDAVCLVLASDIYAESDYIRDRPEFLRLAAKT